MHVGFLIFDGFPMACLTSMIEPLRAANEIVGRREFRWSLISEDGARVTSSAEVAFDPDTTLSDTLTLDQLYLLSAPSSRFTNAVSGDGKLRKLARHGTTIGAISGGIFPMGRAGLLAGVETAVHWCYAQAFAAEFPDLQTSEELIVSEGRRITAAGAAAAFDLALMMIADRLGNHVATEVACWFQHPMVRGQGVAQRKPTLNAESTEDMLPQILARAVDLFESHIEDPLNVADVADAVGVSVRQMERMFRKFTGNTPLRYYRALRMNAARQLVLYSNDTLTDIAIAVGYTSSSTLVKCYVEVFGIHPQEDRNKINLFRVSNNAPLPAA